MTPSEYEKELAKATGQVVVETAKDFRSGLAKVFGPASAELGAMLGDQMRYLRFKNLFSIQEKLENLRAKRPSNEPKQLPPGDAIRVIEAASYEEEDTVQELWARLLFNATSADTNVSAKKIYIDILKSLTSAEVFLLDLLWECELVQHFRSPKEVKEFDEKMNALAEMKWRKIPEEERAVAIQNLLRLRCIAFRPRALNFDRMVSQMTDQGESHFRPRSWFAINPNEFFQGLNQILKFVQAVGGITTDAEKGAIPLSWGTAGYATDSGLAITVREMNFRLTPLGTDLMRACNVSSQGE